MICYSAIAHGPPIHYTEPKDVLQLLTNNTEENVRTFFKNLSETRDLAAADIQRNVHKNYHEFIVISKEIAKLESDMLVIRELLGDMRVITDGLLGGNGLGSGDGIGSQPVVGSLDSGSP